MMQCKYEEATLEILDPEAWKLASQLARRAGAGPGRAAGLMLLLEFSSLEFSAEDPRRSSFPIVLQGDGDRLASVFLAL